MSVAVTSFLGNGTVSMGMGSATAGFVGKLTFVNKTSDSFKNETSDEMINQTSNNFVAC